MKYNMWIIRLAGNKCKEFYGKVFGVYTNFRKRPGIIYNFKYEAS